MLMTNDTDTPSPRADETRQTGTASEAPTFRPAIDDARTAGREALGTAREMAGVAWGSARSYARNAGGMAGEKLGSLKSKAADFQATAARRIADEPVKAVAIGAAAGALFAALLLRRGRGPRR